MESITRKHENLSAGTLVMEDTLSRELIEIEPFIMKEEIPDNETHHQQSGEL